MKWNGKCAHEQKQSPKIVDTTLFRVRMRKGKKPKFKKKKTGKNSNRKRYRDGRQNGKGK